MHAPRCTDSDSIQFLIAATQTFIGRSCSSVSRRPSGRVTGPPAWTLYRQVARCETHRMASLCRPAKTTQQRLPPEIRQTIRALRSPQE